MEKYYKKKLADNMKAALPGCVNAWNICCKSLQTNFPNVKRTPRTFWVLWGNIEAGRFLARTHLDQKLAAVGLAIDNSKTIPEQPFIYGFLPDLWRAVEPVAQFTGWKNYLAIPGAVDPFATGNPIHYTRSLVRSGAIIFDENGIAFSASDADSKIDSFCTLTPETSMEKDFIKTGRKLMAQAEDFIKGQDVLQAARIEMVEALRRARKNAPHDQAFVYDYPITQINNVIVTYKEYGPRHFIGSALLGIPANEDQLWNELKTYYLPLRKNDSPSAYNAIDTDEPSIPEVWEITGYRPKFNPELRQLYPGVYADIPLTETEAKEKLYQQNEAERQARRAEQDKQDELAGRYIRF